MDANIKAIAEKLAATALEKKALDLSSLQQHVSGALANPYLRNSLLGAGAGGLLGLVTGGEDKKRKALHYALLGGLGGAGLTAGKDMLGKALAPAPKELQAPVKSTVGPILKGTAAVGGGALAGTALAAGAGAAGHAAHQTLSRSNRLYQILARGMSRLPPRARIIGPLVGAGLGGAAYMFGGDK